jgi:hypothetical protein
LSNNLFYLPDPVKTLRRFGELTDISRRTEMTVIAGRRFCGTVFTYSFPKITRGETASA